MSVLWQQKTHGVHRKRDKVDPTTTRLFALAIGVVAVVMALYLTLSTSSVKLSVSLWTLHNQMADIQRENSRLEMEIARNSSIPVLVDRSVRLGFVPADSVEYVTLGEP